ncbi:MAG TPA: malto-oligosyltrehalose synthase [Trebonia sp.]|nr:malto-oligosyltrehalose synthase [Trebonia sp.]
MPAGGRHGTPVSTYRVQLTPDFGFAAVADIADYLADLGVTHVYLSPILQATPGSAHGYDVTDHSRVRDELGGEPGFRAMAATLRGRGIGTVVDIVPNHMAVPAPEHLNPQLWSVLRDGRESEHAHWFDVDWTAHENRILLPILAGPFEECLADLVVDPDGPDGFPVLRYFDHVLPLWPGTARLPMAGLLESQHYKLAGWRTAVTDLNYRRFFDITSLIGVRVEDPDVFDATHAVILRLAAEGLIDGLRVDHPDGLADPRGYFRRLAEATGGMWVVAEKILAWGEQLPADWPVAGTTGYDALGLADRVFLDPAGAGPLTDAYEQFTRAAGDPDPPDFATIARTAKQEIAAGTFSAEVARLVRSLQPESPPGEAPGEPDEGKRAEMAAQHQALVELLAAFEVYRAYTYPDEAPAPQAEAAIRAALAAAAGQLPEPLHAVAAGLAAAALSAANGEFATRFQQTTGPVLAKGIEDTAFYRWPRLTALNEVGGDPAQFGIPPREFHEAAGRLQRDWPRMLTTLSTHDTKRQEDVRARLAVLAEIPGEWSGQVAGWHARVGAPPAGGAAAVDPDTEYLMWQALVGAWPISGYRLSGYLTKAVREAKRHTSWTDQDPAYEAAVLSLAAQALGDAGVTAGIADLVGAIGADARANSLGLKLVQLTMPGVADVYQGCELAGLSLVDPDNRRPVDYARCRSLLAVVDKGELDLGTLDAAKILVTSRALRLRRAHPDWFTGPGATYQPVAAEGPAAGHVVAFARGDGREPGAVTVATRLPAGLRAGGGWGDTTIALPAGTWRDALTGRRHPGGPVPLASLTEHFPVALLEIMTEPAP